MVPVLVEVEAGSVLLSTDLSVAEMEEPTQTSVRQERSVWPVRGPVRVGVKEEEAGYVLQSTDLCVDRMAGLTQSRVKQVTLPWPVRGNVPVGDRQAGSGEAETTYTNLYIPDSTLLNCSTAVEQVAI